MSDPLQKRPIPALLAALTFVAIFLVAAHATEIPNGDVTENSSEATKQADLS